MGLVRPAGEAEDTGPVYFCCGREDQQVLRQGPARVRAEQQELRSTLKPPEAVNLAKLRNSALPIRRQEQT